MKKKILLDFLRLDFEMSSNSKPKPSRKPKYNPLKRFDRKTNKKLNTEPIDDSMLSIREMKSSDKPSLANIINNSKRDYYVNIYRFTFRSWFTYLTVACLLAVSLSLIGKLIGKFFETK